MGPVRTLGSAMPVDERDLGDDLNPRTPRNNRYMSMHSSQVQHNEKAPVRNGRDHRVNDRADNMGTRPGRVQLNEKAPADESSRHITGRHDQSGPHHLSQVQHNENALGGNGHGLRKQVNATNVTTSLDRVQLNEKALAATKPRTKGNELSRGQRNENARTTHTMKPQTNGAQAVEKGRGAANDSYRVHSNGKVPVTLKINQDLRREAALHDQSPKRAELHDQTEGPIMTQERSQHRKRSLFTPSPRINTTSAHRPLQLGDYIQTRNTKYEGKATAVRVRASHEGYGRESPQLAELYAAAKSKPPLFGIVDSSSDIELFDNEEQMQCAGMLIALLATDVVSAEDLVEVVTDTVSRGAQQLSAAITSKQYDHIKERCYMLSEDTAARLANAVQRMTAASGAKRRRSAAKANATPMHGQPAKPSAQAKANRVPEENTHSGETRTAQPSQHIPSTVNLRTMTKSQVLQIKGQVAGSQRVPKSGEKQNSTDTEAELSDTD